MTILAQFLLRLTFGLAIGMAITSPRQVSSGYFRNHLYVTLGLTTLAALATGARFPVTWLAAIAAIMSYLGAVSWLYEAKRAGLVFTGLVACISLIAACMAAITQPELYSLANAGKAVVDRWEPPDIWRLLGTATSGLALGVPFAAMLLGHWYLNSPSMQLAPLYRLLAASGVAVAAQAIVSGTGLIMELSDHADLSPTWALFALLRWSFGLIGAAVLLWMARKTLEIPNTQSATGILYVTVIGVFVGELTGLLLSAESAFPL